MEADSSLPALDEWPREALPDAHELTTDSAPSELLQARVATHLQANQNFSFGGDGELMAGAGLAREILDALHANDAWRHPVIRLTSDSTTPDPDPDEVIHNLSPSRGP